MYREILAKWQINMRYRVRMRDKYTCQYCLRKGKTIDHVIPLSKGGNWLENNIVVACFECNGLKKDKTLNMFIREHKEHLAQFGQDKSSILARIATISNLPSQWGSTHIA